MLLSIDFEDYYHDISRKLNLKNKGFLKVDALYEKYEGINNFLKKYSNEEGNKITFFCTGIIAKKVPELIHQIASDGHEIACHYFYHDFVSNEKSDTLRKMLWEARESLEKASGKTVRGFRAPYFAINKSNSIQYKIIEEVFDYDSSFCCSNLNQLTTFQKKMELTTLRLIPLYAKYIFRTPFRLGGTYLKIFPYIYSKMLVKDAKKLGFSPHIYIHPYEFDISEEFKIPLIELKKLGYKKALYYSLRQYQRLFFRNKKLKAKLKKLILENPLEGTIESKIYRQI